MLPLNITMLIPQLEKGSYVEQGGQEDLHPRIEIDSCSHSMRGEVS